MKRIFLCLLAFVFSMAMTAQGASWQVFTEESGLPSSRATCFAATDREMAVGTSAGVAVYQGDECSWMPLALPDQIASCEIRDVAYDEKGGLWIATSRGVCHRQKKDFEVFGTADGLPTLDAERLQVLGRDVFVGLFGGFIVRASVPETGRTTFVSVNYDANRIDEVKNLRTIGVSQLAMRGSTDGWVSMRGAGIVRIMGVNETSVDRNAGLPSDWVEAMAEFQGPSKEDRMLAGTSEGIGLIREGKVQDSVTLPGQEATWVTCLTVHKRDQSDRSGAKPETPERRLAVFLGDHSVWLGTKGGGLWRFEDGLWTQYLPGSSRLPSATVNRLYVIGHRVVACTDGGLVLIALGSNAYDEFKNVGIGSDNFKTIYPYTSQVAVRHIAIGRDFWAATDRALCRFLGRARSGGLLTGEAPDGSSMDTGAPSQAGLEANAGKKTAVDTGWQIFCREDGTLYSDKITRMERSMDGAVWMIFDEKYLARLRMVKVPNPRSSGPNDAFKEIASWTFITEKHQPWAGDTKLTGLWSEEGKLYVGTKGAGYYVLESAAGAGSDPGAFVWRSFGFVEGLVRLDVIGFARWQLGPERTELAILHPDSLSLFDGKNFRSLDLGGRRTYVQIVGDSLGNLWMASDGGLFRIFETGKIQSYTKTNAGFESDRVTAVSVTAKSGGGLALWVACDNDPNGQDQAPNTYRGADGKIHTIEADIDGTSLHYYDGLTWDKWKVQGVFCMVADGDYLWMGTNIRLRRFMVGGM